MSEEVKVVGQLSDILDAISNINDKNVYPVFIPSLDANVMFRELSTKQEKMLVKTIVDNPVYNSEFIFAMRKIIKENCTEDIDIDQLTIIDKTAICLTMRSKSIGDTFEYTFKEVNRSVEVTISDYIDKFKDIKIPEQAEVGDDDITVVCGYPNIGSEYALEREFRTNVSAVDITDIKEAREALGVVFTNEIVKYIKEVRIKQDDKELVLNMDEFKFRDRIAILEKLNNKILMEIMSYIETANKDVQQALQIELDLTENEAKAYGESKLTSILEAGSDFFIIS